VLAYGVTQRVREFGIRQALGANPRSILALVLSPGLTRVGIGMAIGLAGALALSTYLDSMLSGVSSRGKAEVRDNGTRALDLAPVSR
jgi:putative ABC transport system permease protein